MASFNQEEYEWAQDTKEYIKFRDVINDANCGHWIVWDELGKLPSQEKFLEAMDRQNLDIRRLKVIGWNNHDSNNGGLLNYGMRKQFYIPNLYNWDLSIFEKDFNNEKDHPNEELLPCPFCGGKAEYQDNYEIYDVQWEDFWAVVCTDCGMNTKSMGKSVRFKADARALWNRRI